MDVALTFRHDDAVVVVKVFERKNIRKAVFRDCDTKKILLVVPHVDTVVDMTKRTVDIRDQLKALFLEKINKKKTYFVVVTEVAEYTRKIKADCYLEAREFCERELRLEVLDTSLWDKIKKSTRLDYIREVVDEDEYW